MAVKYVDFAVSWQKNKKPFKTCPLYAKIFLNGLWNTKK